MKLINKTDISDDLLREVIRFVRPSGLSNFTVTVKYSRRGWGGWAWHGSRRCMVRVCNDYGQTYGYYWPYQYGQHKGQKWWTSGWIERLVLIMAHELRHLWQGKATSRRGYVWGARGRYSEVDTEAYALRKLREWRRSH